MKNKTKIYGFMTLLIMLAVPLLWNKSRVEAVKGGGSATTSAFSPPSSPPALPSITGAIVNPMPDPMQALLQTPILLYGLVLDQEGHSVSGAKISVSVFDNMITASTFDMISDANGKFTIRSRGIGLRIEVTKSGYYYVDPGSVLKPSIQGFDFGADLGRGVQTSDQTSPVIFHIRKAGNPIPLDRILVQSKVPRDGTPISISLSKISKVVLQISCRTMEDVTQLPNASYDWRCEVNIEGGSIQEVKDEQSFIAPESGYVSSAIIDMPKTLDAKKWNSRASKNYWLLFPDNTFGKIRFQMIARGDHFSIIDGFRNPSTKDRNLEPKLDDR